MDGNSSRAGAAISAGDGSAGGNPIPTGQVVRTWPLPFPNPTGFRSALAEPCPLRFAAVHVHDAAGPVRREHGEHDATVEMLAAGRAVQAELLQAGADTLAGATVAGGELEAERAVGVTEAEVVDGLV